MSTYEKARKFVYRQGRPLDWARWRFHLEGGSQADVMEALAAYQNAVISNNAYPHAPWWATEEDQADSYNPTACLAGVGAVCVGRAGGA